MKTSLVRSVLTLVVGIFCLIGTGCHSIDRGGWKMSHKEEFHLSIGQKADIWINGSFYKNDNHVILPLDKSGRPKTFEVRKPGFKTASFTVKSKVGWNQVGAQTLRMFGGIIPMGEFVLETATGGFKVLSAHNVHLELEPL